MKTEKSQLDKFKEAAREAECDTDEKAFAATLRTVAQSKAKHASDCAVYNAPAMEPGPCDCGARAQR